MVEPGATPPWVDRVKQRMWAGQVAKVGGLVVYDDVAGNIPDKFMSEGNFSAILVDRIESLSVSVSADTKLSKEEREELATLVTKSGHRVHIRVFARITQGVEKRDIEVVLKKLQTELEMIAGAPDEQYSQLIDRFPDFVPKGYTYPDAEHDEVFELFGNATDIWRKHLSFITVNPDPSDLPTQLPGDSKTTAADASPTIVPAEKSKDTGEPEGSGSRTRPATPSPPAMSSTPTPPGTPIPTPSVDPGTATLHRTDTVVSHTSTSTKIGDPSGSKAGTPPRARSASSSSNSSIIVVRKRKAKGGASGGTPAKTPKRSSRAGTRSPSPSSPIRAPDVPDELKVYCNISGGCNCNKKSARELKTDIAMGRDNMEHAKLILQDRAFEAIRGRDRRHSRLLGSVEDRLKNIEAKVDTGISYSKEAACSKTVAEASKHDDNILGLKWKFGKDLDDAFDGSNEKMKAFRHFMLAGCTMTKENFVKDFFKKAFHKTLHARLYHTGQVTKPPNGKIIYYGEEYFVLPEEMLEAMKVHMHKKVKGFSMEAADTKIQIHLNGQRNTRRDLVRHMILNKVFPNYRASRDLGYMAKDAPHPLWEALFHDTEERLRVFDESAPIFSHHTDEMRDKYWQRYKAKYERAITRKFRGATPRVRIPDDLETSKPAPDPIQPEEDSYLRALEEGRE